VLLLPRDGGFAIHRLVECHRGKRLGEAERTALGDAVSRPVSGALLAWLANVLMHNPGPKPFGWYLKVIGKQM
jgi:hypothetical protein